MVNSHTVGAADGIHTAVALAYLVFLFVFAVKVETQVVDNLLSLLRHAVLLGQREYSQLHGSQGSGQVQYSTCLTVGQLLLLIAVAHNRQEHAVHTDRCFYYVWGVALVGLGVEVFNLLAAVLSMLTQVEVGTRMDTLYLLEAERHVEFDICCGIGVMSQFVVVVKTIVLSTETQILMPLHTCLLPFGKPVQLSTGLNKELHLHLFEFAHTEDKLSGNNLVAESLTYLGNTEGQLHTTGFLYIQVVHKDTLSCLGTQVDGAGTIGCATHFGLEHQVELTYIGPVACPADGTDDSLVQDNLLHALQINATLSVHHLLVALVQRIEFLLVFQNTCIGSTELGLVKGITEALLGLLDFFLDFILILCQLILDEDICTIALFGVAVINEGVIEGVNVTRSLPCGGVHKDSGIYTHDILV